MITKKICKSVLNYWFISALKRISSLLIRQAASLNPNLVTMDSKRTSLFKSLTKLIMAISYTTESVYLNPELKKFKRHKENRIKNPILTSIILQFIDVALLSIHFIFGVGGQTRFKESEQKAGLAC